MKSHFSLNLGSWQQSPWGDFCEPNTSYDIHHYAWPYSNEDWMYLEFHHAIYNGASLSGSLTIGGEVLTVSPFLGNASVPDTCDIVPGDSHCSVTVEWSGHYFAPSSALYYRQNSGSDWIRLGSMGVESGTLETDKVVSPSGVEFAIFQYGDDVQIPSSSNMANYRTILEAPEGMMAGPFTVTAKDPLNTNSEPLSGSWYNPDRSGHGLSISRTSNNSLILYWYTYDDSGHPMWLVSDVEPMTDGHWNARLQKAFRNTASNAISFTDVGQASLHMVDSDELYFQWNLNEASGVESEGIERMVHLIGGEAETGIWYQPSYSGWGFTLDAEGFGSDKVTAVTAYFYDGSEPVWVQGIASGPLDTSVISMSYITSSGLCPSCSNSAPSTSMETVGELGIVSLSGQQPTGWFHAAPPEGVQWIQGTSESPVQFQRLSYL